MIVDVLLCGTLWKQKQSLKITVVIMCNVYIDVFRSIGIIECYFSDIHCFKTTLFSNITTIQYKYSL